MTHQLGRSFELQREQLSDEITENTAGGRNFGTNNADTIADRIGKVYKVLTREDKVERACPKCGSWNVANYNPGAMFQMRVYCKNCGFYGCRDGEDDEKWGDGVELDLLKNRIISLDR